jgi:outer membrane lipoprotein carrier protein
MKKVIITAVLLATSAALSFADDMTLESITAKMEEADKSVNSIEFEFSQEIVYNLTNEKQLNNGKVTYLRPDNIIIKQNSPLEQEIVSNGKKVWIYTPKYRQVIVDNWKKWIKSSMVPESIVNFSKDWKDLKRRYNISYEGRDGNRYVLLFKPAEKESFQMKFWVDSDSFMPVKIFILGDNVTIKTEMFNKVLNPKLDKKLFIFKAPAGIEIMNLP